MIRAVDEGVVAWSTVGLGTPIRRRRRAGIAAGGRAGHRQRRRVRARPAGRRGAGQRGRHGDRGEGAGAGRAGHRRDRHGHRRGHRAVPADGPAEAYGGPRSRWGARLARAVHAAVLERGRPYLPVGLPWSVRGRQADVVTLTGAGRVACDVRPGHRPAPRTTVRLVAALAVAGLSLAGCAPASDEASAAPRWHDGVRHAGAVRPRALGGSDGLGSARAPSRCRRPATSSWATRPAGCRPNGGKGFFDEVKRGARRRPGDGQPRGAAHRRHRRRQVRPPTAGRAATSSGRRRRTPRTCADAGFELLNQANNHGNDFGAGRATATPRRRWRRTGSQHTGARGPDHRRRGQGRQGRGAWASRRTPWNNSLIDIAAAQAVVAKAATQADLVVVQVHMGAEGSDKTHVKPGTEIFLGENRGDPIKFSHAVIDAGADLVVGHGPHVLRGDGVLQGPADRVQPGQLRRWRRHAAAATGALGCGGVLQGVADRGRHVGPAASSISTYMNAAGHADAGRRQQAGWRWSRRCPQRLPRDGARTSTTTARSRRRLTGSRHGRRRCRRRPDVGSSRRGSTRRR